jgi:hypothetical protein
LTGLIVKNYYILFIAIEMVRPGFGTYFKKLEFLNKDQRF